MKKRETISPVETLLGMTSSDGATLADDRLYLQDATSGDSAAFAQLYDRHVDAVYMYSFRMLDSSDDAEDLTQEVFILAWKKRATLRIVDHSILPWLLVAARNLSLNRLKKHGRLTEHLSLDGLASDRMDVRPGPDVDVHGRLLLEAIQTAVDALSTADQTLYYLCIDEGLSYAKAAAALGTTHGAVRNRLSRLRSQLQLSLAAQKEGLL